MIAQRLDWNLQHAEVISWRVKDERLQVILIDRCPRGMEDTRDYMAVVADLALKEKIDVLVFHHAP